MSAISLFDIGGTTAKAVAMQPAMSKIRNERIPLEEQAVRHLLFRVGEEPPAQIAKFRLRICSLGCEIVGGVSLSGLQCKDGTEPLPLGDVRNTGPDERRRDCQQHLRRKIEPFR